MTLLSSSFYFRSDVTQIAQDLLGKWLFTRFNNELTGGMIVETEAYAGPWDRACHAYNNRHTKRTQVMFQKGGVAYIYLCYGIHYMLNIVTHLEGVPHAVLIRAINPKYGIEWMLKRREKSNLDQTLTSGPGALCTALGINADLNGHFLTQEPLWIEDRNTLIAASKIQKGPRIGIDYAKEDALLPWRFRISS